MTIDDQIIALAATLDRDIRRTLNEYREAIRAYDEYVGEVVDICAASLRDDDLKKFHAATGRFIGRMRAMLKPERVQ